MMSVSEVPCPPREELEGVALGRTASPELSGHLVACGLCREALERIREDNRFLSRFAVDGALPVDRPAERVHELKIPGYEIVGEIHRGGQGVVYHAVQQSPRRDVAVKVMKQGPFATLADRARFEREIETLGRLDHPNIIAVHDAGVAAGFHYFVMSYVDGKPLDEAVRDPDFISPTNQGTSGNAASAGMGPDRGMRPPRTAAALTAFIKVCDAVHAAHLRGVIHRDLKPSNIRVDRSGEPHVLDFGLAKSIDDVRDSVMTGTGQFVGSLPWASPEQVEGEPSRVDLRTDVYSLGAVFFQLLTGALPFDVGSNLRDALDNILGHDPPRPSSLVLEAGGPPIDDELDTIVLKCLAKDRERRYQSAGDLARDLRRYLAGEPIEAKSDSAMYVLRKVLRRYRYRVAAAAAMVLLLGAFGVVMAFLYQRSARLEREAIQSAAALGESLSRSNIEQGRMASLLGNMALAEQLLWRELLTHRENGGNSVAALNDPPGPPEAYWGLWALYRQHRCLRTLSPQPTAVRTLTLAEDGKSLWTVGRDGVVQRLDEFGMQLDSYRVSIPSARNLAFVDATGKTLFNHDGSRLSIWRRGDGDRPRIELPAIANFDSGAFCVSRSGRRFAAVIDGAAVVWNLETVTEIVHFRAADAPLVAVAISNDDARLAARDARGGLRLWEIESKRLLAVARFAAAPPGAIHSAGELCFSPDGRFLADAWMDIGGRIWNLTLDPPTPIALSERPGNYCVQSFSPDGKLLAIGDLGGGALRVFDAASGRRLAAFVAHPGGVRSTAFTGDGRGIWTCGDGDLRLWEVAPDAGVRVLPFKNERLHSVDFSPDGSWLVAGGGRGTLHRIDTATLAATTVGPALDSTVSSAAIAADGRHVAAATYANAVQLWDMPHAPQSPLRLEHPNRVSHVGFSPDGNRVATACDDGVVRLWRCADGALVQTLPKADDRVPQAAFDPVGPRLAAVVRDGALLVWNLDSGACETWRPATQSPLRAVRFFPDGRWLAAAGADRTVDLWDTSLHRRMASLVGHNQEIYCLDVSPNGELIASGDNAGTIRLWHAALRRPLATLDGHTDSVMSLRFAPDGRCLASVSLDGTLRLWDLSHFARHIHGNLEAQLRRLGVDAADPTKAAAWRRWAELERSAPIARPGSAAR